MRHVTTLLLISVIVLSAPGWAVGAGASNPAGQPPARVTLLFFNDLHGHLTPFAAKTGEGKVQVGGVARMASLIRSIRAENKIKGIPTFVLVAGDILQGTPMSTVFQGEPDIACLNAMGVDAMTVGNHEFDFGIRNFLDLRKQAGFPFLSANVVWKASGRPVCDPFVTIPLGGGTAMTVIGVTTTQLMTTTRPANVRDLAVRDGVETVGSVFTRVWEKGPVVVLSHSRHRTDRAIASAVPGLAAIIGGHDQILLSPLRWVGSVPVLQAFEKGRYLGRADFALGHDSRKAELISHAYIPVTAGIEPDPAIAALLHPYRSRLDAEFKEVIGHAAVFLDAERERVRYEETNLGNLVTDIVREHTGADIALVNSGGLRSSIDAGAITLEDVFKTMPFANEIVVLDLTGAEIRQTLSRSVQGTREDEDGGFLQVSGATFTVRGDVVEQVTAGPHGRPLRDDHTYTVAVPDFLAAGGDGYKLFAGKPGYKTGSPLRELIVDTIRTRGTVGAKLENRIVRLGTTGRQKTQ